METITVNLDLWRKLTEIGQVTGDPPETVALAILQAGVDARYQDMVTQADAEVFRLEAELTAARARRAGLNGSSKASQRLVEVVPTKTMAEAAFPALGLPAACYAVLDSDRNRTWKTREVIEQLAAMGYATQEGNMFRDVNRALHTLVRNGKARLPARGQFTWRQGRSRATQG